MNPQKVWDAAASYYRKKKTKKKNIAIRGFCFVNHVKPLLFLVLKLLWQEIVKSDHLKSLLEM